MSDAAAVLAAFLERYACDAERGSILPVHAYQALFPGFETEIAQGYRELSPAGEAPRIACPCR